MTGTASPLIRPIQAEDFDVWSDLWTGYLTFYETVLPPEVFRVSFDRMLSDDPHSFHGALAEIDGRPLGLVHYLFHAHMWRQEPVCYLQDLYTDPAARGTGVARALVEHVYARADARGAPSVYWLTQEFNYRGRILYDKVGVKTPFIKYSRAP